MPNPIRIKELGHLVLYVKDINISANFYGNVLGWKKIPTPEGAPVAAFSSGRTHHELLLIEVGPAASPINHGHRLGLYHFGLKIGDSDQDLRDALIHLDKHNVPLVGATDHTVTHSLYIEDPDGNEIELYVDVPGTDWINHPELLMSEAKQLNL